MKLAGREQSLQQRLGNGLARLLVHGEATQQFGLLQPMLVKLRGELDEVATDAGARQHWVGDIAEHAVKAVAELVEERSRVVEGQQARLARRRLGEVHDVDDDGPDHAVELFLVAEAGHPGA